ncbi:hypothetical protein JCM19231_5617 [Vibrio ishigakensis]|uniref:Uncharacterized protein n=1 Tax=Vibrio ishigakensis TaxID=1481914 RepID=A0A0B8NX71_9VIBR|nr:hypothetical protein JCM19231_5617 [Vibrio ishigakensis]
MITAAISKNVGTILNTIKRIKKLMPEVPRSMSLDRPPVRLSK